MSDSELMVVPPAVVLAGMACVYDASDAAADAEELVLKVMLELMKYFNPPESISEIEPVAFGARWKL